MIRAEAEAALAEIRDRPREQLVTVEQYAKERSIGVSGVRRAIREGRIDAVRIGRSVRVRVDAEMRLRKPSHADAERQRVARERALAAAEGIPAAPSDAKGKTRRR